MVRRYKRFCVCVGKLPALNHFIKYYTPAEYDRDGLRDQHQRMRRDAAAAAARNQQQSPIRLTIATPHRLVYCYRYYCV